LVTKIFEFRGRKVKEHPGDIFEFLNKKRLNTLKEIERKEIVQKQDKVEMKTRQELVQTQNPTIVVTLADNKQKYEEKKEIDRQKRKIATRITKAEERIEDLEKRIHLVEMFLADPESMAANAGADPYVEYDQLKKELGVAMEEWEKAHEEREA
jgi:ATP-binding cassette subfamily F protein 3